MHTGRLVLTPGDPFYLPESSQRILAQLREIRFCNGSAPGLKGQHYLLAERFMQLVSFMGCSPFIQMEPTQDGQPFCHLWIDGPYPHPIFLQGRNTSSPRCEACRRRIPQWQALIESWGKEPESFQACCPHCGHGQNPASYDWRQSAGCGRLFFCIENIFPNEAIPSPELLNTLAAADTHGSPWRYFYIQD